MTEKMAQKVNQGMLEYKARKENRGWQEKMEMLENKVPKENKGNQEKMEIRVKMEKMNNKNLYF